MARKRTPGRPGDEAGGAPAGKSRPATGARPRPAAEGGEEERKYRFLIESTGTGYVILDERGRVEDANPEYVRLTGRARLEDVLGRPVTEWTAPHDLERNAAEVAKCIRTGSVRNLAIDYVGPDGRTTPVEINATVLPGPPARIFTVCRDITERRRTEAVLRESEDRQRALSSASFEAIFISEKGICLEQNATAEGMFGYTRDEAVGRPGTDWIAPEDRDLVRRNMLAGVEAPYQVTALRKDGSTFPCEIQGRMLDYAGRRVRVTALRDITGRTRAEEALRRSEEQFRLLVETSSDWIWEVDSRGVYTYASPRVKDLLGYEPEEVLGKTPFDLMPADERERVAGRFREIVANREPLVALENVNLHRDGRMVVLETSGLPIFDAAGACQGYRGVDRDVTERKRAEQALRASETRYRLLYEGTPVMMHSINAEGVLVSVSDHWLRTLGYAREEVLGRRSTEFLDEPSREYARTVVLPEFMRTGVCTDIPYTFLRKSGEPVLTLLSAIAERDAAGKVVRSLAVMIDVTERKRAEQALRESEERYRQLFEAESDALFLIDNGSGRILAANDAAAAMYGYAGDELLNLRNTDLSAEAAETRRVTGETPIQKDCAVRIPLRYHRKRDGTVFPVEITGRFFAYQGRPVHIAAIRDITERLQAEEALKESERLLAKITSNYPAYVSVIEKDLTVGFTDGREFQKRNLDPRGFEGLSLEEVFGEHAPVVREHYLRAFRGEERTFELQIDGQHQLYRVLPLSDAGGEVARLLSVVEDVTDRRRAEEELRRSEERFRDLAESLPLTVFEADLEGRFTYLNRAALETFGYARQDVEAGLRIAQVVAPEDRERAIAAMSRRVAGHLDGYVEYRGQRKDGSTFPITVASGPVLRDGRPVGLRGIVTDLTQREELEEERRKTDRLESIGTLAGGIAHDFNNLLQGVFGYISMARQTLDRPERALTMLAQAEQALHRTVGLSNQLLTFSRGGKPVKRVLRLPPIIESTVTFALSGSRVRCELDVAPDLRPVEVDEAQIGQVLQNVILNADQAMPIGGTLVIAARNSVERDGFVEVSVRDSGVGIPPEYLPRVFDPYFTTKERGSGLGLATSYSIMKNHGGEIVVRSEPGRGSTFTLLLPASDRQPAGEEPPSAPSPARTARVLLMDDEEIVRRVTGELLRSLGHEVEVAADGGEAVERYRQARVAGRPFDVVILDLTIRGGMGGVETMRLLREIEPAVRAIVSSGYSDDAAAARYRDLGFAAFLKKPYDLKALQAALSGLLR